MEACLRFLTGGDSQKLNREKMVSWKLGADLYEGKDLPGACDTFQKDLLEKIGALPEDGSLVILWENAFSLHAFCQGLVENTKKDVCQFSYVQMRQMIEEGMMRFASAGFHCRWFYPYPSLSFTTHIFSDDRLPESMECEDNLAPEPCATLESFDERAAVDRIVAAGMYAQLANAYMVVISKKDLKELPDYCRFSTQRRTEKQIATVLYPDRVEKRAYTKKAAEHVNQMQKWEKQLSETLAGISVLEKPLSVNRICSAGSDGTVIFAFAEGKSLEQILDGMLTGEGREEPAALEEQVKNILLSVCSLLKEKADRAFESSEEFDTVFGRLEGGREHPLAANGCLKVTDIDFVCQNILVGDERAVLIDYEWTFDCPVPVDFVLYRFLYLYLEAKDRNPFSKEETGRIYKEAGLSETKIKACQQMETHFQRYVQDGAYVLRNEFDERSKPVLTNLSIRQQLRALEKRQLSVKTDQDTQGRVLRPKADGNIMRFILPITEAAEEAEILIEGFEDGCMLRIGMLLETCDGQQEPDIGEDVIIHGMHMGGLVYLFEQQPSLTIRLKDAEAKQLLLSIEEVVCSPDVIRELKNRVTDLEFIVDNRQKQLTMMQESVSWKITAPLRKLHK